MTRSRADSVSKSVSSRLADTRALLATMRRAGLLAPVRPDRFVGIAAALVRQGMSVTVGFTMSARRCPNRSAVVDERGTLTYAEVDSRSDALAAGLAELPGGRPKVIGLMCRNHRGFVESLIAADRLGVDLLLLNTTFAGPALADVFAREGVDTVVYDDEFAPAIDHAAASGGPLRRVVGWCADSENRDGLTLDRLIAANTGKKPEKSGRTTRLVLLTSGTTGSPKGARHSGGGSTELRAILERVPWRTEETVVVAAPMFHAWGFAQLVIAASMACTVVMSRKFDAEATLGLVDRHHAGGLCVVPVMLERIIDLPDDVLKRYSGRTLRFATASGSRMRPDAVTSFMHRFGDVVYNNYNATEVGIIAIATPADLRVAPDTAGKPAHGTTVRILDADHRDVPTGEVGQIFVRNSSHFDGYTSGATKPIHDGYMASGDLGRLDEAGRLYVVGRDDEMIVSGGENVYPVEVEKILAEHPDVVEAAVIGVDDEQFGQRLAAFVVAASGTEVTADELRRHVRDHLANYKVPRTVVRLAELPRNGTGKIARRELLELAQGHQADG